MLHCTQSRTALFQARFAKELGSKQSNGTFDDEHCKRNLSWRFSRVANSYFDTFGV
jgi:hypothetical protein